MKFKCPYCGRIFNTETDCSTSKKEIELMYVNGEEWILLCHCSSKFSAFNNIEFEPPTGGTGEVNPNESPVKNISLRNYFAGQALVGMFTDDDRETMSHGEVARHCYLYSDAMIKESEK